MKSNLILFLLLIFSFFLGTINKTFALGSYKECNNNQIYKSKVLCDNNYYLYYNLQSIHSSILELIKKYPIKINNVQSNIFNILSTLKNNQTEKLFNTASICKYFFSNNICTGDNPYDKIKSLTSNEFINDFNKNWKLSNVIVNNKILNNNKLSDNEKINIYEHIEKSMNYYEKSVNDFIISLGVILTKKGKFDFTNVIGGTDNINNRLISLTNPKELKSNNKNIKHYKIWLIYLFSPFLNMSSDMFIMLPFSWRYIANPYIIFWIMWYYIMFITIILLMLFIVLSAFTFPLIETKWSEWEGITLKRRNIWILMINSAEFNFIWYLYILFLTNNNYIIKNDNTGNEITIKNEYRVPFIVKTIVRSEYVWLWYILIIWILLFTLLNMLSWYLI